MFLLPFPQYVNILPWFQCPRSKPWDKDSCAIVYWGCKSRKHWVGVEKWGKENQATNKGDVIKPVTTLDNWILIWVRNSGNQCEINAFELIHLIGHEILINGLLSIFGSRLFLSWRMCVNSPTHPACLILRKRRFCWWIKCTKKKNHRCWQLEVRFSHAELHKFSFIRWNTKEELEKNKHLKGLK